MTMETTRELIDELSSRLHPRTFRGELDVPLDETKPSISVP